MSCTGRACRQKKQMISIALDVYRTVEDSAVYEAMYFASIILYIEEHVEENLKSEEMCIRDRSLTLCTPENERFPHRNRRLKASFVWS